MAVAELGAAALVQQTGPSIFGCHEALNTFCGVAWDLSALPPGRLQAVVCLRGSPAPKRPGTGVGHPGGVRRGNAAGCRGRGERGVRSLVIGDLIRSFSSKMTKQPLRTLKDLDVAAILLREM